MRTPFLLLVHPHLLKHLLIMRLIRLKTPSREAIAIHKKRKSGGA